MYKVDLILNNLNLYFIYTYKQDVALIINNGYYAIKLNQTK